MSHKEALQQLIPLTLTGVFDGILAISGAGYDTVCTAADDLLQEAFADTANYTLEDYERVCGLTPTSTALVQERRATVVAKLRARGGQSIKFFTALALTMGYTIEIEELTANTDGLGPEGIFRWRVHVLNVPMYYFRAGASRAGDKLVDGNIATALEALFNELKPDHMQVIFAYAT